MAKEIRLPLTNQQAKTLDFIIYYTDNRSYPPTIQEIQQQLNINNPGYVYKLLLYLEKKGYIIREKGKHRSIRLTEIGEKMESPGQLNLYEPQD